MPRVRTIGLLVVFLHMFLSATPVEAKRATGFSPHIVTRAEWGADESLGILTETEETFAQPPPEGNGNGGKAAIQPPERVRLCQEALRNFPHEFTAGRIETHDAGGQPYAWPRSYSQRVRLIILHHTGESEDREREKLSGMERVRAIYEWHTVHNGWGDIGYHYLVDNDGVIYEGRAGGNGVIGAHAYCANTGTIGVALMGNFLHRYPTEVQLKSARWLLAELVREYRIRPLAETSFHGKRVPTIALHKDVNDTECPGTIDRLAPAIRTMVAKADFTTPMLPEAPPLEESRGSEKLPTAGEENILTAIGSTHLTLSPRGTGKLHLRYEARAGSVMLGERIAPVVRSEEGIGLWQGARGDRKRVHDFMTARESVARGGSLRIDLTILAPEKAGTFLLRIGEIDYTLEVGGRRVRSR